MEHSLASDETVAAFVEGRLDARARHDIVERRASRDGGHLARHRADRNDAPARGHLRDPRRSSTSRLPS
jgi:hypothetical protein